MSKLKKITITLEYEVLDGYITDNMLLGAMRGVRVDEITFEDKTWPRFVQAKLTEED